MSGNGEVLGNTYVGFASVSETADGQQLPIHFESRRIEHGLHRIFMTSANGAVSLEGPRYDLVNILVGEGRSLTPNELFECGFLEDIDSHRMANPLLTQAVQWINDAFVFELPPLVTELEDDGYTIKSVGFDQRVVFENKPNGEPFEQVIAEVVKETAQGEPEQAMPENAPELTVSDDLLLHAVATARKSKPKSPSPEPITVPEGASPSEAFQLVHAKAKLTQHQEVLLSLALGLSPNGSTELVVDQYGHTFGQIYDAMLLDPSVGLHDLLGQTPSDIDRALASAIESVGKVSPEAAELIAEHIQIEVA